MKKLVLIILLGCISFVTHAKIQMQIQPSQITFEQPFQLILTQKDTGGVPDLTELKKQFTVLGTQRQMSYSIINGQSQSSSQWIVTLKAKKAGVLTLPALQVGNDRTDPVTINIAQSAFAQDPQMDTISDPQEVMITTEVNKNKPYVNQQVIYTVKLHISRRLLDADYQGPQVDDALLIPLGDAKRYQTVLNNANYVVEEQNYAIFPQKSGPLKIKSPVFKALVYGLNSTNIQAQNKPITIDVQPIPATYKGSNWLPAKQLHLTQQYEHNNQTLNQNDTLIRTITLEAVGIPAQLLPKLNFENTEAFSVYPEYGKEKTQVKQGELVGSTEIKVTYLFKKPGIVTIPELKLSWFNTDKGKEEVALLPSRTFDVIPGKAQPNNTVMQNPNPTVTIPSIENLPSHTAPNHWSWLLTAAFGLAWLITLGLWAWTKRTKHANKGAYKAALSELKKACIACTPIEARDALLKWAALHWPDASVLNLSDLTRLTRDTHLKKQIHLLSQVLYKNEDRMLWRGDELLKSVLNEKKTNATKRTKTQPLPPINPV